jgi:hypothetical protein
VSLLISPELSFDDHPVRIVPENIGTWLQLADAVPCRNRIADLMSEEDLKGMDALR